MGKDFKCECICHDEPSQPSLSEKKIEKLDVIRGFQKFPDGSIYDVPELAAKINEIIDHINGQ